MARVKFKPVNLWWTWNTITTTTSLHLHYLLGNAKLFYMLHMFFSVSCSTCHKPCKQSLTILAKTTNLSVFLINQLCILSTVQFLGCSKMNVAQWSTGKPPATMSQTQPSSDSLFPKSSTQLWIRYSFGGRKGGKRKVGNHPNSAGTMKK